MKKNEFNLKSTAAKLTAFLFATMIAFNFSSCKKDDQTNQDNAEAGNIPGLGSTAGQLTGTPFTLPDGVKLSGNITGGNQWGYWFSFAGYSAPQRPLINQKGEVETRPLATLRSAEASPTIYYFGSGSGCVDLLIPLSNTRSTSVTVTIPAATILVSASGDYQNGILLQTVTITIPANSDYLVCLALYCGNLSRHASSDEEIYKWGVVSNVKPLLDLCDLLKNKKINISAFSPSVSDDYATYIDQASLLQVIVWKITEESGITGDDISYINSLPNK